MHSLSFLNIFPDENLPEAFYALIEVLPFFPLIWVFIYFIFIFFFLRKVDKADKLGYVRTTEMQICRQSAAMSLETKACTNAKKSFLDCTESPCNM